MKTCRSSALGHGCCLLLALISWPLDAQSGTLKDALGETVFDLSLRYRAESVDEPRFEKEALASTLRTTLRMRTGSLGGFSVLFEAQDTTAMGNDGLYANAGAGDLNNGVGGRPVVADPELTVIHQAALDFEGSGFGLSAGRRELALDDQRFVGPVGWRQNHQAFDLVGVTADAGSWKIGGYFLDRVHRITGGREPMSSVLLNAQRPVAGGTVALFGYQLDYENPARFGLSTETLGARYQAKRSLGSSELDYEAQYARQEDAGDNSASFELDFWRAAIGFKPKSWPLALTAHAETVEGNGAVGFSTPLATLHKFNGWADRFLATPKEGLVDLSVGIRGASGAWSWIARFHRFESDIGDLEFGDELDAQLLYKTTAGQTFGLKVADFSGDALPDVTKVMLWSVWSFQWNR